MRLRLNSHEFYLIFDGLIIPFCVAVTFEVAACEAALVMEMQSQSTFHGDVFL